MTAPHPSWNARAITFRFVPGGPDPITNGFGNVRPSTVVANVGINASFSTILQFGFYTGSAADCHNNF
jgi:hypothetical protein